MAAEFEKCGIAHFFLPIKTKQEINPKVIISLLKLRPFLKEKKIDIIHSHTRVTQVLGCLLERFSGVVYISTCHGFFKKRFFRKLLPCWGKKVIAISEPVKEHLIKDFGVKEEDIRLIYNGIDINKSEAMCQVSGVGLKNKLGLKGGPVIGIVGRLSDVKGHKYLMEAMKIVLEKIPTAQLLIVGEGPMQKELVFFSKKLEIEKEVIFLPNVSDIRGVLSIMDLFVMPSLKEGLGLSLMEAMAMGLAVIGSDVGGIRSLIRHGSNGLLVRPADASLLAEAIEALLHQPERAKTLGENAKTFIHKNFPQEKMINETEKVYSECINDISA